MKSVAWLFAVLPAWVIAGYVAVEAVHDPHIWGLVVVAPVLAGCYTLLMSIFLF